MFEVFTLVCQPAHVFVLECTMAYKAEGHLVSELMDRVDCLKAVHDMVVVETIGEDAYLHGLCRLPTTGSTC